MNLTAALGALGGLAFRKQRGAYKFRRKTKEMMAGAQEQFHDIAAVLNAEIMT